MHAICQLPHVCIPSHSEDHSTWPVFHFFYIQVPVRHRTWVYTLTQQLLSSWRPNQHSHSKVLIWYLSQVLLITPKSTGHPREKKIESLTLEWQQSFPASLSHLSYSRMQGNTTYILIISYSSSYAGFLYSIGNRFRSSTTHINAFTLLSPTLQTKSFMFF